MSANHSARVVRRAPTKCARPRSVHGTQVLARLAPAALLAWPEHRTTRNRGGAPCLSGKRACLTSFVLPDPRVCRTVAGVWCDARPSGVPDAPRHAPGRTPRAPAGPGGDRMKRRGLGGCKGIAKTERRVRLILIPRAKNDCNNTAPVFGCEGLGAQHLCSQSQHPLPQPV